MKYFRIILIVSMMSCFALNTAFADVAVIVHKSNTDTISTDDIVKIFLGKQSTFPGGDEAVPINLTGGNITREGFDATVLGKNGRQMKAYWSKLVFTGKGTPPKEVETEMQMLQLITNNPSMIGYIDSDKLSPEVKVIYQF